MSNGRAGGTVSGPHALALMNGQMSNAILGTVGLTSITGYSATTPLSQDPTLCLEPTNGCFDPTWGSLVAFNLTKNSTLIWKPHLEVTLSAGADAAAANAGQPAGSSTPAGSFNPDLAIGAGNAPVAEYVKNVGDLLVDNHTLIYGTTQLQHFDGKVIPLFRRLCKNDVLIESDNAMVLSPAAPPGGQGEQVLIDAFYRGVTLRAPLDEFIFAYNQNECWMPEAYALEGQLQHRLAALGDIVNTRTRTAAELAVLPAITNIALRYFEMTISAAEKQQRLKFYRTPEGVVQHFLDIEVQKGFCFRGQAARAAAYNPLNQATWLQNRPDLIKSFQLGNIRMDVAEMWFVVHRIRNDALAATFPTENGVMQPWSGSYIEGDTTPSLLHQFTATPLSGFSTLIDIRRFNITASGKNLLSCDVDSAWNRSAMRKLYHPESQIVGAIHHHSFARYPEDRRNATGHISAAVSGNLGIRVVLPDPGPDIEYELDVYCHSHNLAQSVGGGIVKAAQ